MHQWRQHGSQQGLQQKRIEPLKRELGRRSGPLPAAYETRTAAADAEKPCSRGKSACSRQRVWITGSSTESRKTAGVRGSFDETYLGIGAFPRLPPSQDRRPILGF